MRTSRDSRGGARRVPDLYVEQLLLGELPEARRRELEADPELRRRLAELRDSNRRILEQYPPADMARSIRQRARAAGARGEREPIRFAPAWRSAGAVAAGLAAVLGVAAVLAFNLHPGLRESAAAAAAQVDPCRLLEGRAAGARLLLYRQSSGGLEALGRNATARLGERLRIGYAGAGLGYGVIVSLDGSGTVTVHHPAAGEEAAPFEPEGRTLLPAACELNDACAFLRFFLVSAPRPFAVQTAAAAARALAGAASPAAGRLSLPQGFAQSSLLLRRKD